ncbi:MAG TPA: cation diffusion facilitator family transporter [Candidatus Atribacteria bacterium]|nr:cation diffusion facilitator family transporter [Candidatus Atribacteria bacterium]
MDNYKQVKRVLWTILVANLVVAGLKVIIGTAIKSAGMTADGFHSLTDGSSNIVGLIGIHLASKPVDEDHPYGHGKFEMMAALFIAVMLFLMGAKVVIDGIGRLINPVEPEITVQSLLILVVTLCVNIFVCIYEHAKGKRLGSKILISDSMHTRSDIYISIGVLAALAGIRLGLPPVIDPIASFIVSGFIFHAAYEILADNGGILLDKAVVDTESIKNIALSFESVKDVHDIRSRGSEADLYIDMHIMTRPDMSVEESHELIHDIEEKLRADINKSVQLIAHIED